MIPTSISYREANLYGLAERQGREIHRLRMVIVTEGEKWRDHHTSPDKKKYWDDFVKSADPEYMEPEE